MASPPNRHPTVAPAASLPARTEGADASLVAPAVTVELWLEHEPVDLRLGISRAGVAYRSALGLVRGEGRVLGSVVLPADHTGTVPAGRIAEALQPYRDLGIGTNRNGTLPALQTCPTVTAIVTSNGDACAVIRALGSILRGERVPDELLVVDTGRPDDGTLERIREWFPNERIRVVQGTGAGRAISRNVGLRMATSDLVVFADDGVLVDRDWLSQLVDALVVADADAAVGQSLPFDFDHPAHVEMADITGATAGLYRRSLHRVGHLNDPSPVDPATATGSRRVILVRRDIAEHIGGFDTHLGAGTPARGGEDLDFLSRLVDSGRTLVHEPAAVAWFSNDRSTRELRREAFGRGVGLSALLTKRVVSASAPLEALRGVPEALREIVFPARTDMRELLRHDLHRVHLLGLGAGPFAYLRTRIAGTHDVTHPPLQGEVMSDRAQEALHASSLGRNALQRTGAARHRPPYDVGAVHSTT